MLLLEEKYETISKGFVRPKNVKELQTHQYLIKPIMLYLELI